MNISFCGAIDQIDLRARTRVELEGRFDIAGTSLLPSVVISGFLSLSICIYSEYDGKPGHEQDRRPRAARALLVSKYSK